MTLSETRPLELAVGQPDHLFQAWEALRLARRVPWCVNSPTDWWNEFRFQISRARNLIAAHAIQGDGVEAILVRQGEGWMLRRQIEEHDVLLGRVDEVLDGIDTASGGDVHAMVELTEQTGLVEIYVAMHQNRLHQLLGPRTEASSKAEPAREPVLAGTS